MPDVANRAHGFREVSIILMVVSIVATVLRFCSRATASGKRFWWDDWLILANLPLVIGLCGLGAREADDGLGLHAEAAGPAGVEAVLKELWSAEIIFDVSISLAKISVILFYARIFTPTSRRYRAALYFGGALNVAWSIYAMGVRIFQCLPLRKLWDADVDGRCEGRYALFLANAATSLCVDLYVLVLPMPVLWGLQMGWRKKCLVAGVFVVGYSVILITIGRLVAVGMVGKNLNQDETWNIVPVQWFYLLEPPVSIVGACLPPIYHLFRHARENSISYTFSFIMPRRARKYRLHQRRREQQREAAQGGGGHMQIGADRAGDFSRLLDVESGGTELAGGRVGVRHDVRASSGLLGETGRHAAKTRVAETAVDQVHIRRDITVTEENVWHKV